jgi:hypothetical protein
MARQRQISRDLRSLWKRAGERAGDGAGALFAQLDAQDARNELDAHGQQDHQGHQQIQERVRGAAALVRLAERIRAGQWNDEIAEIVRRAELAERAR